MQVSSNKSGTHDVELRPHPHMAADAGGKSLLEN
jgi:hypothetical protein